MVLRAATVLVIASVAAIATAGATCQPPWPPDHAPPGVMDAPRVAAKAPMVEVPDLTRGLGMPVDQALGELDRLGLAVAVRGGLGFSSQDPAPVVGWQRPTPGTRVPVGSTVRLDAGAVMLATPICPLESDTAPARDLRGHLLSEAIRALPGGWSLAGAPALPPTIGLRHIADAYVVVAQQDEDCGVTRLTVALADRPARP